MFEEAGLGERTIEALKPLFLHKPPIFLIACQLLNPSWKAFARRENVLSSNFLVAGWLFGICYLHYV